MQCKAELWNITPAASAFKNVKSKQISYDKLTLKSINNTK
jgi:hypothetical protein